MGWRCSPGRRSSAAVRGAGGREQQRARQRPLPHRLLHRRAHPLPAGVLCIRVQLCCTKCCARVEVAQINPNPFSSAWCPRDAAIIHTSGHLAPGPMLRACVWLVLTGAHGRDGGAPGRPGRAAADPVLRAQHALLPAPQAHRRAGSQGCQGAQKLSTSSWLSGKPFLSTARKGARHGSCAPKQQPRCDGHAEAVPACIET